MTFFVYCGPILFNYAILEVKEVFLFIYFPNKEHTIQMCICFFYYFGGAALSEWCSSVSKVFIFHSEIDKKWRVMITGFHFAWFCSHCPIFLTPSALKVRLLYIQLIAFFIFQNFSIQKLVSRLPCQGVSWFAWTVWTSTRRFLTLDCVIHASIIRFSVSIDVYCSTCLSVLWN